MAKRSVGDLVGALWGVEGSRKLAVSGAEGVDCIVTGLTDDGETLTLEIATEEDDEIVGVDVQLCTEDDEDED